MAALVACGLRTGPVAAQEVPAPPQGDASIFESGPGLGVLTLPPDSGTPPIGVVLVLHDAMGPDQRSAPYVDQLLGARIATIDMQRMAREPASRATLVAGLARDPRTRGLRIGVLGFGAGAQAAALLEGPVAARALLYPGCERLSVAAGAAPHVVFLAHGDVDATNTTPACAAAAARLAEAGMTVRHRVYHNAGYAWDHPIYGMEQRILLPRPGGSGRIVAAPWPELTVLAASQVAGFFSAAFQVAP